MIEPRFLITSARGTNVQGPEGRQVSPSTRECSKENKIAASRLAGARMSPDHHRGVLHAPSALAGRDRDKGPRSHSSREPSKSNQGWPHVKGGHSKDQVHRKKRGRSYRILAAIRGWYHRLRHSSKEKKSRFYEL